MKWWRKSKDFHPYLSFQRDMPPPTGSVAYEIFTKRKFYSDSDLKQQIWKSDWFEMDDDKDVPFFEYCVFVPSYNYTLSLIWEENKKRRW